MCNFFYDREFIIMYRKLIFLLFAVIPSISKLQKNIFLLFISFISVYLTSKIIPFKNKDLNILEVELNITVFISLFSACFFLLDLNEFYQAIALILILFVNILFVVRWVYSFLQIIIYTYQEKMLKYCKCLINFIISFKKSMEILQLKASFCTHKTNKIEQKTSFILFFIYFS